MIKLESKIALELKRNLIVYYLSQILFKCKLEGIVEYKMICFSLREDFVEMRVSLRSYWWDKLFAGDIFFAIDLKVVKKEVRLLVITGHWNWFDHLREFLAIKGMLVMTEIDGEYMLGNEARVASENLSTVFQFPLWIPNLIEVISHISRTHDFPLISVQYLN